MNLISDDQLQTLQTRIVSDDDIDLITISYFLAVLREHRYYKTHSGQSANEMDLVSRRADLARRILAADEHALSCEQLETVADVIFHGLPRNLKNNPLLTDPTQMPTEINYERLGESITRVVEEMALIDVAVTLLDEIVRIYGRPTPEWSIEYQRFTIRVAQWHDMERKAKLPHGPTL